MSRWPTILLSAGMAFLCAGLMYLHADLEHGRSISAHETMAWVFVRPGSSDERVVQIAEQIKAMPVVMSVESMTSAQSLERARQMWPDVALLIVEGKNPFPPYILVRPREPDLTHLRQMAQDLRLLDSVEEVSVSEEPARQYQHQTALASSITLILVVGAAVVMFAAIMNQMRVFRARRWSFAGLMASLVLGVSGGSAAFGLWKVIERSSGASLGFSTGFSLAWVCFVAAVLTALNDVSAIE